MKDEVFIIDIPKNFESELLKGRLFFDRPQDVEWCVRCGDRIFTEEILKNFGIKLFDFQKNF